MRLRRAFLLPLIASLLAGIAHAEDSTSTSQLSMRIGLLSSSVTVGSTDNRRTENITVPETLEFEYEIFSTNHRSFFLRGTMAYELSDARVGYLFVGGGMRFYLIGNAMTYDRSDTDGNRVVSSPTSRLFLGPDFGLSKVEVLSGSGSTSTSSALTLSSTNYDVGVHIGYVYQVSRTFGVEALAGASFVYGFTTVSAVGTAIRTMVGITQYF
jgi:hypothetical protein